MDDHSYTLPLLATASPNRVAEHLFWASQTAKAQWRNFTGKPVHAVRRFMKREGMGKGSRKGKGKGKGSTSTALLAHMLPLEIEQVFVFRGEGKGGKSGKRSSGKGKGRRGNPLGPDGQPTKCHKWGSTEHFEWDCTILALTGHPLD